MAQLKWKENGSWRVRKHDGTPVDLNTQDGADYVLRLQNRLADALIATQRSRRGRPRKQVGPTENK